MLSFPNWGLGEFRAQNGVTETEPCLGTEMGLLKLGLEAPKPYETRGLGNSSLSEFLQTKAKWEREVEFAKHPLKLVKPQFQKVSKLRFVCLQTSVSF